MQGSVPQPSGGSRCGGTNKRGERCRRRASSDGYCIVHGGKIDMAAIGRKGGKSKETALRKEVRVDDELREQAREVLAKALRGEEVDREQLAAARSLFSYRPSVPLPGEQAREQSGGKPVVLADLVREAVACGLVRAEGGRVLVEGVVVEYIDPSRPSAETARSTSRGVPSASATLSSPEADLAELVSDDAPQFDESAEAKHGRRYGSDPDVVSWPQP